MCACAILVVRYLRYQKFSLTLHIQSVTKSENDQSLTQRHTARAENFENTLVVVTGFGRTSDATWAFSFFNIMTQRELQKNSPYTAGMTGCGFMVDEMTRALPLFMSEDSDALLKQEIQNNEVLLITSLKTRQRAVSEFNRRFKSVPLAFWKAYLTMTPKMQILAMFFVLLKAYKLYFDFQVEVVRNKWNSFNQTVSKNDFLAAISDIACNDEFVDSWSDNTRDRVASAFLSVLRKVGFISDKDGDLRQLEYSDEDLSFFVRIGEPWFLDAILIPPYRIETIKSIAL